MTTVHRQPPCFVSHIGKRIFLDFCENDKIVSIVELGFVRDASSSALKRYLKQAPDGQAELAEELRRIRDCGIAFAEGKDWSPAAIFTTLKREGLLSGDCRVIYLVNPNKPLDGWELSAEDRSEADI